VLCGAVWCCVVQCVAACCSVLPLLQRNKRKAMTHESSGVAAASQRHHLMLFAITSCSVLQCVAVCCSTHESSCIILHPLSSHVAVYCIVLQCVATRKKAAASYHTRRHHTASLPSLNAESSIVLQVRCSLLQCVATRNHTASLPSQNAEGASLLTCCVMRVMSDFE